MKKELTKISILAVFAALFVCVWMAASNAYGKISIENVNGALVEGETGLVAYVIDGDSLVLDSGLKVKLAGIKAPQRAWPEQEQNGFPLADKAATFLETLAKGKSVKLYYGGERHDRYKRAIAQLWLIGENGEKQGWLQEEIVRSGYARVYSWPGQTLDVQRLYEAEQSARKARRGIWNNRRSKSFYKIRNPDPNPLAQYVDSVQLVEGIIVSTANVRGTVYLNFGSDYKTDFTVGIGKKLVKSFKNAGMDPEALEGARIRVRGWIEMQNGPIIWVNDPRRIEIIQ